MARAAPTGEAGADEEGEVVGGLPVPPVVLLGVVSPWLCEDALALGDALAVLLVDVQVNAQTRTAVSSAVACKPRFIFVARSLVQTG